MDIGSEELLDSRPFTANDVWCELAHGLGDFLAVKEPKLAEGLGTSRRSQEIMTVLGRDEAHRGKAMRL